MLYGRRPFGHGMSQDQIYNKGVILKATKVEFPPENSKKSKISEGAKDFICACLKYNPDERLNPT
jgi:tousled-like kinase